MIALAETQIVHLTEIFARLYQNYKDKVEHVNKYFCHDIILAQQELGVFRKHF